MSKKNGKKKAKYASLVIRVSEADAFEASAPVELFRGPYALDVNGYTNYTVAPDGQRFVMVPGRASEAASLAVVTRWFDELAEAEGAAGLGE